MHRLIRGRPSLPEIMALSGVSLLLIAGWLVFVFWHLTGQAARLDDRIRTGAQVLSTIDSTDVALEIMSLKRRPPPAFPGMMSGWAAQVHSEIGSLVGLSFPWSSSDRSLIEKLDRNWGKLFDEILHSDEGGKPAGARFGTIRKIIATRQALSGHVGREVDRMDTQFHALSRQTVAVEAGIVGVGLAAFSLFALSVFLFRRTAYSLDRITVVKSYLSAILEAVPFPLFLKDSEGRWLRVNRAALALFGLDDGSWKNRTDREISENVPFYKEFLDISEHRDRETLSKGQVTVALEMVRKKEGHVLQFETTRIPLGDADGSPLGIVVSSYDMTRRIREKGEILRLKAINEALSEVDEFILGIPAPEELFDFICREVVSHFDDSLLCQIGVPEKEFGGWRWVASSGGTKGVSGNPSGTKDRYHEFGGTLFGNALESGERQIWNDDLSGAGRSESPWAEELRQKGIRSAASFPFFRGSVLEGVLSVWSSEEGFFISDMLVLFENIARSLSFALDNFDREAGRQRSEESRKQMVGLFKALSRINYLTAEIPAPEILYQETVRIAVEAGELPLGWIGLLEGTDRLRFVAVDGPSKKYVDGLVISSDPHIPEGRGPGGEALRSNEPVIFRDLPTSPDFRPWRERAENFGLSSSATFSFRRGGKVVGAMGLYHDRSHSFFPEQIGLFRQFAETLSFALDNWDREQQRKNDEAQMALAASVALNTREGVVIADPEMRILTVNQAFTDMTGLSETDSKGMPLEILQSDHRGKDFWQDILQAVSSEGAWKGEIAVLTKEGTLRQELMNISVVRDRDGETTHHVAVFTDISQIKAAQMNLEYLSLHDPLTGLPNRRAFGERISQGLKAAGRHRARIGVAIMDLDGFKEVNDRFGHEVGDRFLVEVSRRLVSVLRGNDVLARLGGDEFGLLLGGIGNPMEAGDILDRFIQALQFSFRVDEYAITLSGSIGIALYPEDGSSSEALMSHADLALYQAKEMGKNRWISYEPALSEALERSSQIRSGLRAACENPGALLLHYQPQVDILSGEIRGFEALVRWNHPEKGLLSAEDFIDIAETDAPLIATLGNRILDEVLSQLEQWELKGWSYPVSVNIGALHFLNPGFMEDWSALWLRFSGIPRSRLRIGITESATLRDLARVQGLIETLREQGTDVVLDGFGIGFSSLTELKELPVSGIRIDRFLTRTFLSDARSTAVISGVTTMARMLKIDILLKGVENFEQGILFLAAGGSLVQGYAVGPPKSASELPAWIESFSLPADWSFWRGLSWPPKDINLLRMALEQKRTFRGWTENPGSGLACLHDVNHRCFWEDWLSGEGKERFGTRPEFLKMLGISAELHKKAGEFHALFREKESPLDSAAARSLLNLHLTLIQDLRTLVSHDSREEGA